MMYRPMMAEPPQPITAESLRCGFDRGEIIIDTETWESWLPPAVLEPASFGTQITKLIERFPYPLPPQGHYDEMEFMDGQNLTKGRQEPATERPVPTPEEIQKWDEILIEARGGGKDFDEIVKATRKALEITSVGKN